MDIKVFFLMMLLVLCAFSNVMLILQLNRGSSDDFIVEPLVGLMPVDALIISFMTGLGEYHVDGYSSADAWVLWIMFIMSTIILQLIFMNMLIAIMTDSFARVTSHLKES